MLLRVTVVGRTVFVWCVILKLSSTLRRKKLGSLHRCSCEWISGPVTLPSFAAVLGTNGKLPYSDVFFALHSQFVALIRNFKTRLHTILFFFLTLIPCVSESRILAQFLNVIHTRRAAAVKKFFVLLNNCTSWDSWRKKKNFHKFCASVD